MYCYLTRPPPVSLSHCFVIYVNLVDSRAEECTERMLALQLACTAVTAPMLTPRLNTVADYENESESLKDRLTKIHDLRRAMLEALMLALTDGKSLLELLRGIAANGSIDSRPDTLRVSTEFGEICVMYFTFPWFPLISMFEIISTMFHIHSFCYSYISG